jgi:hypothetical protein
MALLPPIPLYRRLLRAHRKYLEPEMRILGDSYVKQEFRAHQKVENPAHIVRMVVLYTWEIAIRLVAAQSTGAGITAFRVEAWFPSMP